MLRVSFLSFLPTACVGELLEGFPDELPSTLGRGHNFDILYGHLSSYYILKDADLHYHNLLVKRHYHVMYVLWNLIYSLPPGFPLACCVVEPSNKI